jgi:hypothetical protein
VRALAVLCNVVLAAATCLVLATEGAPKDAIYVVFTLLLMLIPLFTVFVLLRSRAEGTRPRPAGKAGSTTLGHVAVFANIVLLALICLAIVDQYPHPDEPGFLAFVALTVLTPILSALVLLRRRNGRAGEAR